MNKNNVDMIIVKTMFNVADREQYPYTVEPLLDEDDPIEYIETYTIYIQRILGKLKLTKKQAEELILRQQNGAMPVGVCLMRWPAELCEHTLVEVDEAVVKCLTCGSDGTLLAPIHVSWMKKVI